MDLACNEVELINPRVSGASYALLASYRLRDWHDRRGNWHVVVKAQRVPEIERVELRQRRTGTGGKVIPGYTFQGELDKALARLQAREQAARPAR
jgi:hypothetical protein